MTDRPCRVRLTEDAVADLQRLEKKSPQIVRDVFAKMLLLERSNQAGEPLLGALVGFRKLPVNDRDYRIVWRATTDDEHNPVLEIAEVWAAGARSDSEVYEELQGRVSHMKTAGHPMAAPLSEVVAQMGRWYRSVHPSPEPQALAALPPWMFAALSETLHLTHDQISALSQVEAQQILTESWNQPRD